MFFTKEDYKKIENWLKLNSIKDSQLPELKKALDKDDIIAIVHKGESVKVKLSLLSAYLQGEGFEDFLESYYTKQESDNRYISKNTISKVLQITEEGINSVAYKETEHFLITKRFMDAPEKRIESLLD